ncbi:hypothetical protein ACN38_g4090 [Penicillium nordicum]|uniref:Uncharacterized protein n=1 Tax=Penicillium nordicum TaxID=229535 RepID=A0A0M8PBW6_9EURO|nr:hypothetical protein ACN38_g4090 [Penicillium nordicum]
MYMCSNTGLSGWAELRIALVFVFAPRFTLKLLIKTAVRILILPGEWPVRCCTSPLGPGCQLPDSLFPPLTSPPPPRFVDFSEHVRQQNTCLNTCNKNSTVGRTCDSL